MANGGVGHRADHAQCMHVMCAVCDVAYAGGLIPLSKLDMPRHPCLVCVCHWACPGTATGATGCEDEQRAGWPA